MKEIEVLFLSKCRMSSTKLNEADGRYQDYTQSPRLFLRHQLLRVRHVPIRGTQMAANWISKLFPTPKPNGRCIVKTIHGLKMLVDPVADQGIEPVIFSTGTYEEGTLSALRVFLRQGGTFFDVGANIGLMTLFAAKHLGSSGQVVAFEAMPSTFELLRQNIGLNNLSHVNAVNMAIGSGRATAEIFDDLELRRGAASLVRSSETAGGISIPVISLDEYVSENQISDVTCIKIDVEGWELEVLRGAKSLLSRSDSPICIIECSRDRPMKEGTVEDLFEFLTSVNEYRLYRLVRGKERPSQLRGIGGERLPDHDNVFGLLPSHLAKLPAEIFARH